MTQDLFPFNTSMFDKFYVGADEILKNFAKAQEFVAKSLPGYPPYNIIKVDENKYCIEIAVAGFGKQNIDIEIDNGTLTINGKLTTSEDKDSVNYLYKGIADRMFSRKFALADTVQVKNAELVNGMLRLWLENLIVEDKKPVKIDIEEKGTEDVGKTK